MFFFTRENEKCPRKQNCALFLIFFSGGKYFSRPLFFKFSRAVCSFLGHIFRFFHGLNLFFTRAEFLELFQFSRGKVCIFFSGKDFFISGRILPFFSRAQFFLLGQFSIFFSASFKSS